MKFNNTVAKKEETKIKDPKKVGEKSRMVLFSGAVDRATD